jgi:hypothetical protein
VEEPGSAPQLSPGSSMITSKPVKAGGLHAANCGTALLDEPQVPAGSVRQLAFGASVRHLVVHVGLIWLVGNACEASGAPEGVAYYSLTSLSADTVDLEFEKNVLPAFVLPLAVDDLTDAGPHQLSPEVTDAFTRQPRHRVRREDAKSVWILPALLDFQSGTLKAPP